MEVNDPRKAFARANHEIKRNGGTLTGTNISGVFQGSGVRGNYRLNGDNVFVITITKKPFIYPESMVIEKIKDFFTRGGN